MVIGAVDHSDAHILARQLFCSFKPAKTRANDYDVRFSCGGVFHIASFRQRSTSHAERPTFNSLVARDSRSRRTKGRCQNLGSNYLVRLMPKPIARSKTRKAVAKRFKITARGKVLRAHSSRRHLMSAKTAKRKRRLGKAALVDTTDVARVKANLPFG